MPDLKRVHAWDTEFIQFAKCFHLSWVNLLLNFNFGIQHSRSSNNHHVSHTIKLLLKDWYLPYFSLKISCMVLADTGSCPCLFPETSGWKQQKRYKCWVMWSSFIRDYQLCTSLKNYLNHNQCLSTKIQNHSYTTTVSIHHSLFIKVKSNFVILSIWYLICMCKPLFILSLVHTINNSGAI